MLGQPDQRLIEVLRQGFLAVVDPPAVRGPGAWPGVRLRVAIVTAGLDKTDFGRGYPVSLIVTDRKPIVWQNPHPVRRTETSSNHLTTRSIG